MPVSYLQTFISNFNRNGVDSKLRLDKCTFFGSCCCIYSMDILDLYLSGGNSSRWRNPFYVMKILVLLSQAKLTLFEYRSDMRSPFQPESA